MPKEQYTHVDYKTRFPFSKSVKQNICDLQGPGQRKRNFAAWGVIVQGYSLAKLTQEGDKLIAISAIAREMKPLMQCKYLAGDWEADLVRQLGWPGYDIHSRPTTYRAPSWSWASVDGRNQFWFEMYSCDHYHALAEVVATHIDLAGEDEMGPVTGGNLDILGQLFELKIREENEMEERRRPRRSGQQYCFKPQIYNFTKMVLNRGLRALSTSCLCHCPSVPKMRNWRSRALLYSSLINKTCIDEWAPLSRA